MKKKLVILSSSVLGLMPVLALAAPATLVGCGAETIDTIEGILCRIGSLLNSVVPVLVVLGVVYFVWGVITYVVSNDEEAKEKGRNRIIYGIIGLAVIIGMWGLVNMLGKTFGIESGTAPTSIDLPGINLNPTTTP